MARERHRALMQHFDELCDLPAEQRESRLAELRSHDPDLASHVASLLAQDAESSVLGGVVQRLAAEVAQDHAGRVLSGRYELLRSLGGGGGGSVWEALDRIREERVAIKLLGRELGTDPAAVRRFEREFRAVARLDHPNILRVHALGRDGDDRFIVMAFAPGGDLRRLARAPLDELLPLFLQLALALDYVHGRRIVHRDLKPANVVLSGDEPPVPLLADFGIARVEDEDSAVLTRTDAVVGTIDYLSPEQVRGGRVDPRSDLYALGCLIFWLVSGRAPFEGGTLERMSARLHRPAPSLRSVAPTAPPELAALVARLLEADPQRRPQSAVEVAHELAGLFAGDGRDAALGALLRSTQRGAFLYDPGLVGRDADLDALRTWLAAPRTAADAQGAEVLALIGDGGIGKTYLLGRLLDGLRTAGWPTWEIGFRRSATGAPGPFVALEDALSLLGADSLRAEAVRLRPIASGQDSASRDRRAQRLAEAMALATDAAPNRTGGRAVLVIDDLHQADPGAIDLLSALLRALGRDPARAPAVIVSLRPAGRDRIDALRTAGCPVREHALDPIDAPAIETIAARMLASSPSALPPALIAQLSRESQGHPLLVRADLRALIDDGWLRRVPGGWEYHPPERAGDFVPSEVIQRRLRLLPERAVEVLRCAAAVGPRFEATLVGSALRLAEDELEQALDAAVDDEVIARDGHDEEGGERFRFAHDRYLEALVGELDAIALSELHDAIGGALLALRGAPVERVAYHLARGSDPARAYPHLMAAGEAARREYDSANALRWFEEAAARVDALPPERHAEERARAGEALADVLVILGRSREGAARYEALLRAPWGDTLMRARWLRKQGMARLRTEDTGAGVSLLQRALVQLGDRPPAGRWLSALRFARELTLAWIRRALRRPPRRDERDEERAFIHGELAQLHRWIDIEGGVWHLGAFLRLAERTGAPALLVDVYATFVLFWAFVAKPRHAARVERRARLLATDVEDRAGLARLAVLRGASSLLLTDDEPATLAQVDESIRLAERVGDRFLVDYALAARGWCDTIFGNFHSAITWFDRAHGVASQLGSAWLRIDAEAGRCYARLAAGDLEAAHAAAHAVLTSDAALAMPAFKALATEALGCEAFMRCRFRESAAYLFEAQRAYRSHGLERAWGILVHSEHTEALLSLVDEEGDDAVPDLVRHLRRNWRRAARRMGQMPMYRGCDLLLRAVYESRRGRTARALRLIERVLETRPAPRESYIDIWITYRIGAERLRLGAPRDEVAPFVDEAEGIARRRGAVGMLPYLAHMRRLWGLGESRPTASRRGAS